MNWRDFVNPKKAFYEQRRQLTLWQRRLNQLERKQDRLEERVTSLFDEQPERVTPLLDTMVRRGR